VRNDQLHIFAVTFLASAALLILGGTLHGQPNPVKWEVSSSQPIATLKAGSTTTVKITAQIAPDWYIYSMKPSKNGPIATNIRVPEGQGFKLAGRISGPRPTVKFDPSFGINVETYTGTVVFSVPIRATSVSPSGLRLKTSVQACNGQICLSPKTVTLSL
jgi:hypothetical protein